jgi:hypothetical protein
MSPELETLDQLLGGDELPVSIIRNLFADNDQFIHSITMMLAAGEVRLLENGQQDVPQWRWRDALTTNSESTRLMITETGTRRIA